MGTSLQYLRARYYNTNTGQFISKDKYKGDFTQPGTLNRYAYCGGNPVRFIDPTGQFVSAFFAGMIGGTKGEKIGGAIGAGIAFAVVTAAIIVFAPATLVAAVTVGVVAGAAGSAIGNTIGQVTADIIDKKDIKVDAKKVLESAAFGAAGGATGGLLGTPLIGAVGAIGANLAVNTLVVDPIIGATQTFFTSIIEKRKSKGCYGYSHDEEEKKSDTSIRTDNYTVLPATPMPW